MPAATTTRTTTVTKAKSTPYSRPTSTTKKVTIVHAPAKADSTLAFPTNLLERARFKLPNGKSVTGHQWKVYDYILTIPQGRVTTYASIAKALESSPRAVGGALRDNPFAPFVPCHRIIASTLFIGGFQGEWGTENVKSGESAKLAKKLRVLQEEGVEFDDKGKLVGGESVVWHGK